MKLRSGHSNQGGVLVVTILICSLVGLMLAAYLSMVSGQHTFTQRSQIWNNTIPLCEAGVEEAMAHINHISVSSNFAINGWTKVGTRFTNESYLNGGKYTMDIDNGLPPTITVWGTLKQPLANGNVTRAVQVQTKMNQRFPAAVLARGTVNLTGSGRIDSFNSTNVLVESDANGQYDPARATDKALVGTTLRSAGAISVGNMSIYGSVATGPGAGTVLVNPNGGVGDKTWHASNRGFVQAGHHVDDANFYIPPANLPKDFVAPTLLTAGVYPFNGTNYKYLILTEGDYQVTSISLSSSEKMLINAKARLRVLGGTTVSTTTAGFILLGADASVEWYSEGPVTLSGGGCVNVGGLAKNFSIICLSSATVNWSGHAKLIGTIYAPLSTVNLSGTSDAYGAITCNNFTLSGTMSIHFDEALRANPKIRFLASSWKELKL